MLKSTFEGSLQVVACDFDCDICIISRKVGFSFGNDFDKAKEYLFENDILWEHKESSCYAIAKHFGLLEGQKCSFIEKHNRNLK